MAALLLLRTVPRASILWTCAQPDTTRSLRPARVRTPHAGRGAALYSRRMQAVLPGLLLHPRCRRAGKLSPRRAPLPCTQHGQGRGRRHARPPYRAEVLTLDPLPRRSAPARSEHSPTLRERGGSLHRRLACRWRCVGRRSMQLGLRHYTLEYFYSYGMCAAGHMHPLHTTARHPKVSESQNGARSTFASFDRLYKRFA